MYIFLFSLFLALVVTPAFSVDATYDAEKKELTIPWVVAGDTAYTFLTIRLDSVKVVDMGTSNKVSGKDAPPKDCPSNLPKSKYDKIALGMTLEQVNQTLGCQYSQKSFPGNTNTESTYGNYMVYSWWLGGNSGRSIYVAFDPRGKQVISMGAHYETPNEPNFKWILLDNPYFWEQ